MREWRWIRTIIDRLNPEHGIARILNRIISNDSLKWVYDVESITNRMRRGKNLVSQVLVFNFFMKMTLSKGQEEVL